MVRIESHLWETFASKVDTKVAAYKLTRSELKHVCYSVQMNGMRSSFSNVGIILERGFLPRAVFLSMHVDVACEITAKEGIF